MSKPVARPVDSETHTATTPDGPEENGRGRARTHASTDDRLKDLFQRHERALAAIRKADHHMRVARQLLARAVAKQGRRTLSRALWLH